MIHAASAVCSISTWAEEEGTAKPDQGQTHTQERKPTLLGPTV